MVRPLAFGYRLASAAYFTYIIAILPVLPPALAGLGGHYQFLTINGLTLTTVALYIGALAALFGSPHPNGNGNSNTNPGSPPATVLQAVWHFLLAVALPVELIISLLYWSIVSLNSDFMFMADQVILFPPWLDLSLHLAPALVLLVSFARAHGQIVPRRAHLVFLTLFGLAYFGWMHIVFYYGGNWPYPFLALMTHTQRILFSASALVVLLLVYYGSFTLARLVLGTPQTSVPTIPTKKAA
ncbi:hypothetical protein H4R33_004723 [Dimargaris cristalligena]|nr:hypothetical protein H4R33_004723 [Dimargaris cristalligena]